MSECGVAGGDAHVGNGGENLSGVDFSYSGIGGAGVGGSGVGGSRVGGSKLLLHEFSTKGEVGYVQHPHDSIGATCDIDHSLFLQLSSAQSCMQPMQATSTATAMQQVRDNIERIRQVWSNDSKIELAKPKQRDVEICRKQSKHGSKHDQSIGNQGVCPPQGSMSKADNDNEQRPQRHNDNNNDDCTVWRSCVAGNPLPFSKVEGQVLQAVSDSTPSQIKDRVSSEPDENQEVRKVNACTPDVSTDVSLIKAGLGSNVNEPEAKSLFGDIPSQ